MLKSEDYILTDINLRLLLNLLKIQLTNLLPVKGRMSFVAKLVALGAEKKERKIMGDLVRLSFLPKKRALDILTTS